MTYIPVNLLDVDAAGDFEVLPAGLYQLVIKGVKQDVSREGNPVLRVTYVTENGPDGSTSEKTVGKTVVRSYSLMKTAQGFFKRLVLACGITPAEFAASGGQISEEMLIGRHLNARLVESTYGDRKQNEVQEIVPETMRQFAPAMQSPGAAVGYMQAPMGAPSYQPPAPMPPQQPQYPPQAQPQYQYQQQPPPQQPQYPPQQPQYPPQAQPQYPPQAQPQQSQQPPQYPPQAQPPIQGPGAFSPPPAQPPPAPMPPPQQEFVPPAQPPTGLWPGFGSQQQFPAPPAFGQQKQ